MSLEEEIKQVKFHSQYHKLVVNIMHTASWLENHHQHMMKEFGVTLPQFNVLRILRGQKGKPLSINELIERMIDKSSNASRIVDKLESKQYVLRRVCSNDRRQVEVTITEKGLGLLKEMDEPIKSLELQVRGISEKEAETINILLDQIKSEYNKQKQL